MEPYLKRENNDSLAIKSSAKRDTEGWEEKHHGAGQNQGLVVREDQCHRHAFKGPVRWMGGPGKGFQEEAGRAISERDQVEGRGK